MNPKINTSLRGRGKWGDFLVAIIPLSWCANILLNSNFILRLIEWQNESSLFTVRIHGKQWYWVYKFDFTDTVGILTAPKNIGRDKWVVNTPADTIVSDSYLQVIQLRAQYDWINGYWKEVFNDNYVSNENSKILNIKKLNYKFKFIKKKPNLIYTFDKDFNLLNNDNSFNNINNNFFFKTKTFWHFNDINYYSYYPIYFKFFEIDEDQFHPYTFEALSEIFFEKNIYVYNTFLKNKFYNYYYNYDKLDDLWDVQRNATRKVFKNFPFRVIKPVIKYNFLIDYNEIINFKYYSENNVLSTKTTLGENFWVMKQKRYKKKIKFFEPINAKNFSEEFQFFFDNNRIISNALDYTNSIQNNNLNLENINNLYKLEYNKKPEVLYKIIRNNRQKTEALPIHLCRRLLRTKKTLVLPTHVNISLITNSYDVVHSWYIPSLGIKLDCVPGRSTHHTLYLDYVGLYYGQCAEICGRYHHHMPIRIAGLPFEHFAVWWQTKGHIKLLLKKFNREKLTDILIIKQRYVW